MRPKIVFALLREGSTEDGLMGQLERLLLRSGASEALGRVRPYRGSVRKKLEQLLMEDQPYDLAFIHRDADSSDSAPRRKEILDAVNDAKFDFAYVPIVPVQETEAWLLTDEDAIRAVVGRPSGRTPIHLPNLKNIEATARPKEILKAACLAASETTGRRRAKEEKLFAVRRRALLDRLDPIGPVRQIPSWRALEADVELALHSIVGNSGSDSIE